MIISMTESEISSLESSIAADRATMAAVPDYMAQQAIQRNIDNKTATLNDLRATLSSLYSSYSAKVRERNNIPLTIPGTVSQIRYAQKEVWIEEIRLNYTVTQNNSFDNIIRNKLNSMDRAADRIELYELLTAPEGSVGGHQAISSPLEEGLQTLIANRAIFTQHGYDMKTWNLPSAFTTLHNGIDISCNANAVIKSPVSGYITAITDNSITIMSLPMQTYDVSGHFIVTVTLGNIQPLDFTVNQTVIMGQELGNVVNSEYCGNIGATNYLHISVYTEGSEGNFNADPYFLIE
jgi:hypothetical protein